MCILVHDVNCSKLRVVSRACVILTLYLGLWQVRATAIGEPSLKHLTSEHKRKPGYIERLPPLALLLEDRGVDYSHPNADRDVQLPLEAFEDLPDYLI